MFKSKIFNLLKTTKIEGIIFRAIVFLTLSINKWVDYSNTKQGIDLIGGLLFTIMLLFLIDDYNEYKKTKIINEN
jgi:hypothetical protein